MRHNRATTRGLTLAAVFMNAPRSFGAAAAAVAPKGRPKAAFVVFPDGGGGAGRMVSRSVHGRDGEFDDDVERDGSSAAAAAAPRSPPARPGIRRIHFNNAGDSPSAPSSIDAVIGHLRSESELGGYRAADIAAGDLRGAYDSVARLIGAGPRSSGDEGEGIGEGVGDDPGVCAYDPTSEIALVESATVGWTRAFYSLLETKEREWEEEEAAAGNGGRCRREATILVSEAEYAANVVAMVKFARDRNRRAALRGGPRWRVVPVPSETVGAPPGDWVFDADGGGGDDDDANPIPVSAGTVDLNAFGAMLRGEYDFSLAAPGSSPPADGGRERGMTLDPESIVMVCVTHVPTNSGIINPVEEIGRMIDEFNREATERRATTDSAGREPPPSLLPPVLYLVDACQSVGQLPVDVRAAKCHALAATGRKYLRGPRGTGFIYVRADVAEAMDPSHVDHAGAPVRGEGILLDRGFGAAGLEGTDDEPGPGGGVGLAYGYKKGAARLEFWESSPALRLGLGAAIRGALDFPGGMDGIGARCSALGRVLRRRLREMERVRVYHDHGREMCGIVTFEVRGLDPALIKEAMEDEENGYSPDEEGGERRGHPERAVVHLSVVPATSTPLDSSRTGLGTTNLVRASLSYFNTEEEIDMFCQTMEYVIDAALD